MKPMLHVPTWAVLRAQPDFSLLPAFETWLRDRSGKVQIQTVKIADQWLWSVYVETPWRCVVIVNASLSTGLNAVAVRLDQELAELYGTVPEGEKDPC